MKFWLLALTLIIIGVVLQSIFYNEEIPTFFIDLDAEPMERFKEVAQRYALFIRIVAKNFESAMMNKYNLSREELYLYVHKFSDHFDAEYIEEMKGIAKYAKVDIDRILLAHVHYELSSMCTTIVSVDDENVVWMLRNFDYFRAKDLRMLTINLDFQRKNQSIFKGTTLAGVVSVLNAVKRDSLTIALNRRLTPNGTLQDNLRMISAHMDASSFVWPSSLLLRKLLGAKSITFHDAVDELSTVPLLAPVYIILGGRKNDEGVIITRDREGAVKMDSLNIAEGKRFIVATNLDVGSPCWRTKDWRYNATVAAMNASLPCQINEKMAWNMLKVSYFKKSLFSSLMSVESYYLSSVLAR